MQNGRRLTDNSEYIFLKENRQISLNSVQTGSSNNKPAIFQIMIWYQAGDMSLPEAMMAEYTDALFVTRSIVNVIIYQRWPTI